MPHLSSNFRFRCIFDVNAHNDNKRIDDEERGPEQGQEAVGGNAGGYGGAGADGD